MGVKVGVKEGVWVGAGVNVGSAVGVGVVVGRVVTRGVGERDGEGEVSRVMEGVTSGIGVGVGIGSPNLRPWPQRKINIPAKLKSPTTIIIPKINKNIFCCFVSEAEVSCSIDPYYTYFSLICKEFGILNLSFIILLRRKTSKSFLIKTS